MHPWLLISDGMVFYTTSHGRLHALDISTGKQKWTVETAGSFALTVAHGVIYHVTSSGLRAMNIATEQEKWIFPKADEATSSPMIWSDTAYFGSGDGYFYAVDVSTGLEKWSIKTPTVERSIDLGNIRTEVLLVDGIIYFGTTSGYLYAVNAVTGEQKWHQQLSDVYSVGQPVISDGLIYVTAQKYLHSLGTPSPGPTPTWARIGPHPPEPPPYYIYLYAIDMQTGREVWKFGPEGRKRDPMRGSGSCVNYPIVSDGVVYCATGFVTEGENGIVYALDARTGKQLWKHTSQVELRTDSLAAAGGLVYVMGVPPYLSDASATLFTLDAKTGQEKWTFRAGAHLTEPVISNGVLYTGSRRNQRGKLYALDANTGKELRSLAVPGGVTIPPILLGDSLYTIITDLDVPGDQIIAVK